MKIDQLKLNSKVKPVKPTITLMEQIEIRGLLAPPSPQ